MHVDLRCVTVSEYSSEVDREIDWDNENKESDMISYDESKAIQHILSTEVSIYLLRRSTGHCGSVIDDMCNIRQEFIMKYEKTFGREYVKINKSDYL